MTDLEILHVIIISINYCLQIALSKAGAFNDPVLKYLTGKITKYTVIFTSCYYGFENRKTSSVEAVTKLVSSLHLNIELWMKIRTLMKIRRKKFSWKAGIFEIGTNKEGIWKKNYICISFLTNVY